MAMIREGGEGAGYKGWLVAELEEEIWQRTTNKKKPTTKLYCEL